MATYFHGAPEIQPDGLQTLYLMNPGYAGYSDAPAPAPAPANMVFLNSPGNSLNPVSLSHNHQSNQRQHFVGIPLQSTTVPSQDSHRSSSIHSSQEIPAIQGLVPHLHYNLWTPTPSNNSMDLSSQLGLRRPSVTASTQQGLSLSLSPQQAPYSPYRPDSEIPAPVPEIPQVTAEDLKLPGISSSASAVSNGILNLQSVLMGSKYLKATQQLLDEVVNLGKGVKGERTKGTEFKNQVEPKIDEEQADAGNTNAKRVAELTTAERQELQMKKAKLVSMLDEVEQRYRQYHHQMQIVVSSFEAIAGYGSARTYTALALHTISKQFRCLRDAISSQIHAARKTLGEEDCLGGTKSQASRLRFVDHHLRQQRALQQLGMIQQNAWRPQRGLPERAVSILRAWLFENFLHPYPKDSDKHMLAKQTGLTRSQVSNWFINARVRLWKPMVEEMYFEETKEQEQNNVGEKIIKSDVNEDSMSKSSTHQESSPTRTEQTDLQHPPITIPPRASGNVVNHANCNVDQALMQPKIKKAKSNESLHLNTMPHSMNGDLKLNERSNQQILMNFGDGRQIEEGSHGYYLLTGSANHGGSFGAYPIGEIGRFDPEQFTPRFSGNSVSLTLGLPHCENLSLSEAQPSYLSSDSIPLGRRLEMRTENNDYCNLNDNPPVVHPPNPYESINIQRGKRFAAQLLQDFIA